MFDTFGNETQVPSAHWRQEPTSRGTWNILSTCLITLSLCVWTTLHISIPGHKENIWRQRLRKVGWLMLGLLAPEMVAYTAWYQYRAAGQLSSRIKSVLGQPSEPGPLERVSAVLKRHRHFSTGNSPHESKESEMANTPSTSSTRRHEWTAVHSFYLIMGGFVFDTSLEKINFLPGSRQRLSLTPEGMIYLFEHEPNLVPDISMAFIQDKSKASGLAKTIVCLQALWFCVQCITRLAQGMGVALLELNVFAHSLCVLLVYFWWWDKPLDIEEPTVIDGDMANEICAFMCMRSYVRSGTPEIPWGVRYGDLLSLNIVETSTYSDNDLLDIMSRKWWRPLIPNFLVVEVLEERAMTLMKDHPPIGCYLLWKSDTSPAEPSLPESPKNLTTEAMHPVDITPQSTTEASDQSSTNSYATSTDYPAPQETETPILIQVDAAPPVAHVHGFHVSLPSRTSFFCKPYPKPQQFPEVVKISQSDALRWQL